MTGATGTMAGIDKRDLGFFGHPKGLAVLFLTEMWERFSYYGMRALLIFYLTQHFLYGDRKASLIFGSYTALVYVLTVVGGTLADHYLGPRKAVTFGAVLLAFGHFGMTFEGPASSQLLSYKGQEYALITEGRGRDVARFLIAGNIRFAVDFGHEKGGADPHHAPRFYLHFPGGRPGGFDEIIYAGEYELTVVRHPLFLNLFYLSLSLIIMGVGFLKANISTIVGSLYGEDDPRRDGGFTIFYMGINLGAFLSVLACGYLGQAFGWKYGFGLAGVGMLAGLMIFLKWQHLLDGKAEPPNTEALKERIIGLPREYWVYLGGLGGVVVCWQVLQHQQIVDYIMNGFGFFAIAGVIVYSLIKCTATERDRMLVAVFLILSQLPFMALFEQAGSSLNLFTDRAVDRTIFGWEAPASMFLSLNALFIFMLAPFFALMWVALSRRGWEPSTPAKFSLAIFQVGLGFLVLVVGMSLTGPGGLTPLIWIVLLYLLHTSGELCLYPVGLSMITKLSVPRVVGMMMGTWFLVTGFANYLSGLIAAATGSETIGGEITDLAAAKATYMDVYTNIGLVAMVIAVGVLAFSPMLRKGMHGVH